MSTQKKICYLLVLTSVAFRSYYYAACIASGFVYGFPSVADLTIEVAFLLTTSTAAILNIGTFANRSTFIEQLNQMLKINRKFSAEFLRDGVTRREKQFRGEAEGRRYNDGCWIYMKLLTLGSIVASMEFGMFFLITPTARLYYYSWLFGDGLNWWMVPYFVFECYSLYWMYGILFLQWYTQLMYASSCSFWLDQISASKASSVWTRFPLKGREIAFRIYKSMQIITILFNASCQEILLPMASINVCGLNIVCLFVSIKFHASLPLLYCAAYAAVAALCFVHELVTYPLFAKVNTKSMAFFHVSGRRETMEERKVKRALRVLGVSVGGRFLMKKKTVLTFVSLFCTSTFNLLVST